MNPEWAADCAHWHGRLLTGTFAHWCPEFDDLPVDETCHEWPCGCAYQLESAPAAIRDVDVWAWLSDSGPLDLD